MKINVKQGFMYVAVTTFAAMVAYKLGKREGFEQFLKKAFEDNPSLKEINFKVENYTITWKK